MGYVVEEGKVSVHGQGVGAIGRLVEKDRRGDESKVEGSRELVEQKTVTG